MTGCTCPLPRIPVNPRMRGSCQCCGKLLDPLWTPSDENHAAFFSRIESGFVTPPGEWFTGLQEICLARDRRGRQRFGYTFLNRRNLREADEELADSLNYFYMEELRARRLGYEFAEIFDPAYAVADAYRRLDRVKTEEGEH